MIIVSCTSLGIRVSLGHSNASSEMLRQAVKAGATGFTHLGNACPQLLDRHDNILWRALDTPGLTVSLIPDAIHVSPPLFRLLHRALSSEAIYYTTDAMAAAGAPPGRYTIGALEAEVGADQIVRQPGKSNYAGSALRPIDGVFRAAEMLNGRWFGAWDRFSIRPARFIGLDHGLAVGCPADFWAGSVLIPRTRARRKALAILPASAARWHDRPGAARWSRSFGPTKPGWAIRLPPPDGKCRSRGR